jgi:hypothetical protein
MTTAHEAIQAAVEAKQWVHDPINFSTTDGIRRAIEAQWAAIQALADHIDGRSSTGKSTAGSHPAAPSGPARRAPSA